jgi:hypothetical protein
MWDNAQFLFGSVASNINTNLLLKVLLNQMFDLFNFQDPRRFFSRKRKSLRFDSLIEKKFTLQA